MVDLKFVRDALGYDLACNPDGEDDEREPEPGPGSLAWRWRGVCRAVVTRRLAGAFVCVVRR